MLKTNKIIVTGGNGRFGRQLEKISNNNFVFPNKKKFNILNLKLIKNYLKKMKPKYVIHLAGLSRPMSIA